MGCGCSSHVLTEKEILRVIVFGLENSGKTSLVQCLKTSKKTSNTYKYISTHGAIAANAYLNMQANVHLVILDCGGCKHQRPIWPHLTNNCDLVLFTIDCIDLKRMHDAKQALFDLINDDNLIDKPLLIVFTKSDKRQTRDMTQLEQALDLFMIQDRPVHKVFFSSITLDGFNSISTWFAYFSYCKRQGKDMKLCSTYEFSQTLNSSTVNVPSEAKYRISAK